MSRPGSLKSFRKEKRDGDVTSGAACFKEATTEANSRNHCSELTIYLDAELQVVESELLALQKVMVKLQSEMREALDTKG